MWFMEWIIERLEDISAFLYDIYLEIWDWPWLPGAVAEFFYWLSSLFIELADDFSDFDDWLEWAYDEIRDILSWSNIRSLIRGWLPDLEDVVDWWDRWWLWVGQEIDDWWDNVKSTVQGWIDIAVEGFGELVEAWDTFWKVTWPEWTGNLRELRSLWDNFWTVIFPTLVSFSWLTIWWNSRLKDIDLLFETWTKKLAPFWEGWQEIKDSVLEFFADPLKWLYDRLEDFMDRYW